MSQCRRYKTLTHGKLWSIIPVSQCPCAKIFKMAKIEPIPNTSLQWDWGRGGRGGRGEGGISPVTHRSQRPRCWSRPASGALRCPAESCSHNHRRRSARRRSTRPPRRQRRRTGQGRAESSPGGRLHRAVVFTGRGGRPSGRGSERAVGGATPASRRWTSPEGQTGQLHEGVNIIGLSHLSPLPVPSRSPPGPLPVPSRSPPGPLPVPSRSPPGPLPVPSRSPPGPLPVPSRSPLPPTHLASPLPCLPDPLPLSPPPPLPWVPSLPVPPIHSWLCCMRPLGTYIYTIQQPSTLSIWSHWPEGPVKNELHWPPLNLLAPKF